jgi:hypothetical protein
MVGAASSTTVTTNEQLPPPVEDVTTTVVLPTGKKEPDGTELVTVPQSPNASVLGKTTLAPSVEPCDVFAVTTMLFGQSRVQVAPLPSDTTLANMDELLSGV